MALVVVGGAVVLTTAMAPAAMADEITFQDSTVVNAGAAAANSGGNVAIGNASTNIGATGQGAVGGLASNSATTNNTSNGTATITTGAATAQGSVAATDVDQSVAGADDGGLAVAVQDSDVINAGAAFSNTGANVGIGNASTNIAATGQGAAGLAAINDATTNNTSNGTATITTGAATAQGTVSATDVAQTIATDVENGLAVLVQDADVINFGLAFANSGGNAALGNVSTNIAATGQGAAGLFGSNSSTSGNTSNGTATIATGVANAVGNAADNAITQGITGPDGGFLAVMFQDADAFNVGAAGANSGLNAVVGNLSFNGNFTGQGLAALIASNVSNAVNNSDGIGAISTGAATGKGNEAANDITQNS